MNHAASIDDAGVCLYHCEDAIRPHSGHAPYWSDQPIADALETAERKMTAERIQILPTDGRRKKTLKFHRAELSRKRKLVEVFLEIGRVVEPRVVVRVQTLRQPAMTEAIASAVW